MDQRNQCILCSVESCKHHDKAGKCELSEIQVAPKQDCSTGKCDESQCASYKNRW